MTNVAISSAPCFPSEVWLEIFEWATFFPAALDIHAPNHFASGYPAPLSEDETRQGLRDSMAIKHNLTLVCKAWNTLATRFLYRTICIERWTTLAMLWRSLDFDLQCEDVPAPSDVAIRKGRWTTRLEIVLHLDRDPISGVFASLLPCMPNLHIIVVHRAFTDFATREMASLFDMLAKKTIHSLHVLDISCGAGLRTGLLKNGMPLRILRIQADTFWDWEMEELDLSLVEYLNVPEEMLPSVFATRKLLTSLSHVIFPVNHRSLDESMSETLSETLSSVAHDTHVLTTLIVDNDSESPWPCQLTSSWKSSNFGPLMQCIGKFLPNLHSLIINLWNDLNPILTDFLPPVQNLVMIGGRTYPQNSCDSSLQPRPSQLSGLSSVHRVSKARIITKELRNASVSLLAKQGVRFENRSSRLVHERRFEEGYRIGDSS